MRSKCLTHNGLRKCPEKCPVPSAFQESRHCKPLMDSCLWRAQWIAFGQSAIACCRSPIPSFDSLSIASPARCEGIPVTSRGGVYGMLFGRIGDRGRSAKARCSRCPTSVNRSGSRSRPVIDGARSTAGWAKPLSTTGTIPGAKAGDAAAPTSMGEAQQLSLFSCGP